MFYLIFLELLTVNFLITLVKNLWLLLMFFDVDSAALSTSIQNVVTTCSLAQRCRLVCNIIIHG